MSRKRKLEELIEINTAISSRLDSRDLLKSITLSALALLDADSAEIWLLDHGDDHEPGDELVTGRRLPHRKRYRFRLLASAGTSDPMQDAEAAARDASKAPTLVLFEGHIEHDYDRSFVVSGLNNALTTAFANSSASKKTEGYRPTRAESAFFQINNEEYGLFTISREDPRTFSGDDYYFLEKLAVQAGISLSTSRRFEAVASERDRALARIQKLRERTLIGTSPALQDLQRMIDLAGPSQASVVILGERGVGKELVADALHAKSDRRDAKIIKLNCAGLMESLLESELFGYEKGAFTGAEHTRAGLLEEADGGTLFLDEAGEMSAALQAKLLRFLQEGTFRRVGGNQEIKVNVRVLAATNRDIAGDSAEVHQPSTIRAAGATQAQQGAGYMRRDLFDRLATIVLRIPPLRERRDDIAPLMQHFLARFTVLENKTELHGFAPEIIRLMESADWPGNVRELENAVHRLVILHGGGPLISNVDQVFVARRQGLPSRPEMPATESTASERSASAGPGPTGTGPDPEYAQTFAPAAARPPLAAPQEQIYFDARDAFEAEYIRQALAGARGNISKAAEQSGLDRGNFRLKMNKHNIDQNEFKPKKKRH